MTSSRTLRLHYRPVSCPRGYGFGCIGLDSVDDMAKVTCKWCLRLIAKYGLRPRSDFPRIPIFAAYSHGRFRQPHSPGKHGCQVSFRCPVCGRVNLHGGDYDIPGAGDGHRVSHCACWASGYSIREVGRVPEGNADRLPAAECLGDDEAERLQAAL